MKPAVTTPVSQLYLRATVLLAVAVSIGFSWLVLAAGALKPNLVNSLTQLLIIILIISLLVIVVRRFHQTREHLMIARKNAEDEAALLRQRSAFMFSASDGLSKKLAVFEAGIKGLDPADKYAAPLFKKTAELRRMLDRLETISRLEANMVLTSKTIADVNDVLDAVAKQYQDQFASRGATLQVSGTGPVDVAIDPTTLQEVFASIVDNAAKFMPPQGGLLDIVYKGSRNHLSVSFTDNGEGIDSAKMPELFKPFSRTDGVLQFERQGQGLSLYIDKLCVEIAGGHIVLESKKGAGTTVTIVLPLAHRA